MATLFSCFSASSIGPQIRGEMYRINKVDSTGNVYLFYAEKNDSIFKIISKKEIFTDCSPISAGKQYHLELKSYFLPEEIYIKNRTSGFQYEGALILMEGDSIVRDIFLTNNIKGKCFFK